MCRAQKIEHNELNINRKQGVVVETEGVEVLIFLLWLMYVQCVSHFLFCLAFAALSSLFSLARMAALCMAIWHPLINWFRVQLVRLGGLCIQHLRYFLIFSLCKSSCHMLCGVAVAQEV